MKTRTMLIAASTTLVLAATGSAFAAGGSASDNSAMGGGAAANGVYPAPTQGVEQGVPANGNTGSTHNRHHRMRKPPHTMKPATDTTNIPGADASSDTKGQ